MPIFFRRPVRGRLPVRERPHRTGRAISGPGPLALLLGLAPLLLGLIPLGAAGQVGGEPGDTARGDSVPVVEHPGVVVRAFRAPISAVALPFAVTVRNPSRSIPTAGWSLAEQLPAVPGLQVQSRYNDALGDRIVMRGFGARAQFGVRGIHVLVDGIPATMPDGQTTLNHLDLALLERAEVLRGPAAAAYGNAAGGVLLLTTRSAPTVAFRQQGSVAAGGHGLLRVRSTSGGSHGPVGWTGSVSREWRDGYRPHSGTDRYQATGRVDAPLAGGFVRFVTHGVSYDASNPGSLTFEQYADDPNQAQAFNVAQQTGEEGRHGQLGATWERALGGTLVDVSGYGVVRSLDNPIPPAIIGVDRRAAGIRTLVRSDEWSPVATSWAMGVDAGLQRDDRQNHENVQGAAGDLTLDQTERVLNVAVHGQVLIPVLDRLGAFVSARYDRTRFAATDRLITAENPDDSGSRTMDAFSPAAGLRFLVSSTLSLFGNVSTAFQTPTTTELVNRPDGSGGFNEELEPQRAVSYELGGRATPSSSISVQGSLYRAVLRDALVPFEVPTAPGRQYFRNAGGAVHSGVELAAELTTERVDVMASVSRTAARFSAYAVDDIAYDGNAVPGVRPWVAEVAATSRPADWLVVGMSYQGTGAMAVNDGNDDFAPGHHLFGVRAGGRGVRVGGLDVSPYAGVDNVLDETHVASIVPNAFGARYLEPGPGRTFYLGLDVGFTVGTR